MGAPAISGAELERQLAEGLAERFPGEGGRPRREQETAVYRAAQLEAMGEARLRATLKTVHDDDVVLALSPEDLKAQVPGYETRRALVALVGTYGEYCWVSSNLI